MPYTFWRHLCQSKSWQQTPYTGLKEHTRDVRLVQTNNSGKLPSLLVLKGHGEEGMFREPSESRSTRRGHQAEAGRDTSTDRESGRSWTEAEKKSPYFSLSHPLIFYGCLTLAKPNWYPEGEGAQMRSSVIWNLPGHGAWLRRMEKGSGVKMTTSIGLLLPSAWAMERPLGQLEAKALLIQLDCGLLKGNGKQNKDWGLTDQVGILALPGTSLNLPEP